MYKVRVYPGEKEEYDQQIIIKFKLMQFRIVRNNSCTVIIPPSKIV